MKKNRTIILWVILVFVVSLVACKNEEPHEEQLVETEESSSQIGDAQTSNPDVEEDEFEAYVKTH